MKNYDLVVAQDGSGDFRTVQEAIDAVSPGQTTKTKIYITKGIYRERIVIAENKSYISLIGENCKETVLTYDDHAKRIGPDGEELGTFRSASIYINGDNFSAENITFENSAGPGELAGQALAASVAGDRVSFKNCCFLGFQDTLYTKSGREYYQDCYIEGTVDFIFGAATAVFKNCELFSKKRPGYVTAASTPEGNPYGYVFIDCRLIGEAPPDSVYLGRPWRDFANVAFINCWLGRHIRREGWHNWRKPEREKTARYMEYNSTGPGASPDSRVKWARQLTPEEAAEYTVQKILAGSDGWNLEG